MSISESQLIQHVKQICNQAIQDGNHNDLTIRQVIQSLIDQFHYHSDLLHSKPTKSLIKQAAAETLQPKQASDSNPTPVKHDPKPKPSPTEQATEESIQISKSTSTENPQDPSDSNQVSTKKRRKSSGKARFKSSEMIDSDGNSIPEEDDSNDQKQKIPTKKIKTKKEKLNKSDHDLDQESKPSDPDHDDDKSDQEDIKPKSQTLTNGKKTAKAKRESLPLDKEEEKIKKLKSLVVACGVRKKWQKEFQHCSNKKQQISHLRKILEGLGMKNRMSLSRAKEIKARRDLEAEVNELADNATSSASGDEKDNDHQQLGSQDHQRVTESGKSNSKKPTKNRTVDDSNDDASDDEVLNQPKSKKNPFAFLGDQGSDDSS